MNPDSVVEVTEESLRALEQTYSEHAVTCLNEHLAALGAAQAIRDLRAQLFPPALNPDALKQALGAAEIGEPQPI